VTAVTEGSATVTATCTGSSVESNTDTVNVAVEEAIAVNGLQVNDGNTTITVNLEEGEIQLKLYLLYNNGTVGTVDFADEEETLWDSVKTISGTAATISDTEGSKGLVTFDAIGQTMFNVLYKDDDSGINENVDFYIKVE